MSPGHHGMIPGHHAQSTWQYHRPQKVGVSCAESTSTLVYLIDTVDG